MPKLKQLIVDDMWMTQKAAAIAGMERYYLLSLVSCGIVEEHRDSFGMKLYSKKNIDDILEDIRVREISICEYVREIKKNKGYTREYRKLIPKGYIPIVDMAKKILVSSCKLRMDICSGALKGKYVRGEWFVSRSEYERYIKANGLTGSVPDGYVRLRDAPSIVGKTVSGISKKVYSGKIRSVHIFHNCYINIDDLRKVYGEDDERE